MCVRLYNGNEVLSEYFEIVNVKIHRCVLLNFIGLIIIEY